MGLKNVGNLILSEKMCQSIIFYVRSRFKCAQKNISAVDRAAIGELCGGSQHAGCSTNKINID